MPKIFSPCGAAIASLLLVLMAGCGLRVDYSKFDSRCREWLGNGNPNNIQWEFDKTKPRIEEYYEYYMCLNIPFHHVRGNSEYFMMHWEDFIMLAPSKLLSPRDDKEIFLISILIQKIARTHKSEIMNNQQLLSSWKSAIENMKRKDGWPYSLSYGIYNAITRQP